MRYRYRISVLNTLVLRIHVEELRDDHVDDPEYHWEEVETATYPRMSNAHNIPESDNSFAARVKVKAEETTHKRDELHQALKRAGLDTPTEVEVPRP